MALVQDDDDYVTRFRTKARKLGKTHHSEAVSLLLVSRADALNNRYRNLPCKMRLRGFLEGSYRVDPIFPDKASASDSSSEPGKVGKR